MEEKTKIQRAYDYIVKKGSARQKEIAAEVGTSPSSIGVMLKPLVERGDLVMCKVEVPGTPAQNEYRPGAGMPGEFRPLKERQAFRINPPKEGKAAAPVGATFANQAIAPRTRDPIEALADAIAAAEPEPASEPTISVAPGKFSEAEPAPVPTRAKLELSDVAKEGLKEIQARLDARPEPGLQCGTQFVMGDPERLRFCLWDDGDLEIYDGDEFIKLPAESVHRLHRFLNGWLGEVAA